MLRRPIDLSTARILVTNDDGINAPGLKVLEKVARALCATSGWWRPRASRAAPRIR
jgi:broad specificity polyphosphatase/5'/3'-nucleotidase SurE